MLCLERGVSFSGIAGDAWLPSPPFARPVFSGAAGGPRAQSGSNHREEAAETFELLPGSPGSPLPTVCTPPGAGEQLPRANTCIRVDGDRARRKQHVSGGGV